MAKSITDTTLVTSANMKTAGNPKAENDHWSKQQAPGGKKNKKHTPTQSTSLPPQTGSTFVSDVAMSAYMRKIDIEIVARNMRPNRRIYVFFDGKDVTKLVQKPNIIVIDKDPSGNNGNNSGNTTNTSSGNSNNGIDRTGEDLDLLEGNAKVLYAKRKGDLYYMYIGEIYGANNQVDTANAELVVINTKTGERANVVEQRHSTGVLRSAKKYLQRHPEGMTAGQWQKEMGEKRVWNIEGVNLKKHGANGANLIGQTITILNGNQPGQTTTITGFNIANGEIYLSRGLPNLVGVQNVVYSIGNVDPTSNAANFSVGPDGEPIFYDSGAPDVQPTVSTPSSGNLYTDENGMFVGILKLPDPKLSPDYRFRVGEKLLRIIDSPINDPEDSTTIAEYNFVAYGLDISTTQIVINNNPVVKPPGGNNSNSGSNTNSNTTNNTTTNPKPKKKDPIAQSFYVDPEEYPQGFFTPYVDLFFANKGTLPVEVQIRPMVNGFPSSKDIMPNAISILDADEITVTDNPNPAQANTYTRFEFPSPVYLQSDTEYALVVLTNDFDYDIYVSELGEKILGTDRVVSEQPYLGSLFKSQNSRTYTPIQAEDLMFVIHKCQFSGVGSVIFSEEKSIKYEKPSWAFNFDANTRVDAFEVHSDAIEIPGTTLNYSYRATNASTEEMDEIYIPFKPERRTIIDQRKLVYSPDIDRKSFIMKVDFSTNSPDVSPIIYTNKQGLATVQTLINSMGLDSSRVIVENPGANYTRQNTYVTITANTGEAANAFILTKIDANSTGQIQTIYFDKPGFDYFEDVNVSIVSSDANVSNAVVKVLGETGKAGGPAEARYISKTVTLAPEFDAGDLRVYVTAIRPREADVEVYYKVRNNFDNETIDDKNWVRMVRVPGVNEYSTAGDAIEFEYRPSLSSNNIVYSTTNATFDTFNQFKIKIVMASTDTVLQKIPYVYDMRAIALPGDD